MRKAVFNAVWPCNEPFGVERTYLHDVSTTLWKIRFWIWHARFPKLSIISRWVVLRFFYFSMCICRCVTMANVTHVHFLLVMAIRLKRNTFRRTVYTEDDVFSCKCQFCYRNNKIQITNYHIVVVSLLYNGFIWRYSYVDSVKLSKSSV